MFEVGNIVIPISKGRDVLYGTVMDIDRNSTQPIGVQWIGKSGIWWCAARNLRLAVALDILKFRSCSK